MQYLPEKEDVLAAVAQFLVQQAAPAAHDPALSFRLRIAGHLVGMVARECHAETQQDAMELQALAALLGEEPKPDDTAPRDRHETLRALYAKLSEHIQNAPESELDGLRRLLMEGLAGHLRVSQPKFRLDHELD